ncbi:MAG: tetratricopeptide repeat protein [Pseudobdellovibrionaceae bacterium]
MRFAAIILTLTVMGSAAPLTHALAQNEDDVTPPEMLVECGEMEKPDAKCLSEAVRQAAAQIKEKSWRDAAYRELAKSYASDRYFDKALSLIDKIETPDTKAMTIRGIGMAAADLKLDKAAYDSLFTQLKAKKDTITHLPSHDIAETYIAMSQSFAGLYEEAFKTASAMKNDALQHKAFGEIGEVAAERGDTLQAFKALSQITSHSYRNKSARTISGIFLKAGDIKSAIQAANMVDNAYMRASALQAILDHLQGHTVVTEDGEDVAP